MKIALIVLLFSSMVFGQTSEKRQERPPAVQSEQQETQALSNDVARMRTLLQQMQMNLALVQTTQTPLKHQFELEIEMWNLTLDAMERRLQRMRTTGGVTTPDTVPLRQGSRQGRP
jgi:hypothetical protein